MFREDSLLRKARIALARFAGSDQDGTGGVAAIEFAIVVPILLLMSITTIDIGIGFYRKMQVHNAAQAGAQYALLKGFNSTNIESAVVNASSPFPVTATPPPSTFCGCAASTGVTTIDCASKCVSGRDPGRYVQVSAQGTYKPFLPYNGLPKSFTFSAQATARIQ